MKIITTSPDQRIWRTLP